MIVYLTMANPCLRTWRNERRTPPVWSPITAALSFDGKRWVSIDSLANEPQTGQPNRPPK